METIALETRIRRIREGLCSSPGHVLTELRAFADLPVNAVLGLFFPDLQVKFSNYAGTMYRKPSSALTYGDLAAAVTEEYLRSGVRSGKTADSMILFYFTCLEADCLVREKIRGSAARTRYFEDLGLAELKGFADIAMGEYLDAALKVRMDDPVARKLYAFRLEKAGVMNMTVSAAYQSLVDHARRFDGSLGDPVDAGFPAHSLLIREKMIELFAAPVAYVAAENAGIIE